MATIKTYTTIEQSKKLAEILPLESADMHYSKDFDGSWFVDLAEYTSVKIPKYVGNIEEHLLPCWSLSALYALLPEKTDISKAYSNDCVTMVYWCWTVMSEDENECDMIIETSDYDNPVDACYEMIIKLHERNLL